MLKGRTTEGQHWRLLRLVDLLWSVVGLLNNMKGPKPG
jgi:hypothetical protein